MKTKNSPLVEASFWEFFFLERYTYYSADLIARLQDSRLGADFASTCLLRPRKIAVAEFIAELLIHFKHLYVEQNSEKTQKLRKRL